MQEPEVSHNNLAKTITQHPEAQHLTEPSQNEMLAEGPSASISLLGGRGQLLPQLGFFHTQLGKQKQYATKQGTLRKIMQPTNGLHKSLSF